MAGERVFVSSTWIDNAERRKWVEDAIIDASMVPIGMERFTASIETAVDECLGMAAEADVLVGILAWRYGWIPPGRNISITELEYDAASERLMFFLDPSLKVDPGQDFDQCSDRWKKQAKLEAFKSKAAADQMPAYFREDSLSRKVLKALQKWEKGRKLAPPTGRGEPEAADEIASYRKRATHLHEFLPLAGFQTTIRVPIRLDELYVPLRAVADLRASGEAVFADATDAEAKLRSAKAALELPVTEAFETARKLGDRHGLVLLGDPGSGKTTQLKRMLLWVLRKGPESLGLPPKMLPVFLPLRELRDLESGLDAFIESQLDHKHLKMSKGFGRRLLDRGNLLLLLDGLDEVADVEERERVAGWIEAAVKELGDCRFVVSCRFAGYSPEVRLSERLLEMHLRPLTTEQAEEFIQNWYRIVEAGLSTDSKQAEEVARTRARQLTYRLREPDFRARRVLELARNPLLLANLCLIHRDHGQLPRSRADLYGECVDVLLEGWRAGKGLESPVTAKDGRRVLQPAAYWLHGKEGRTRAAAKELTPVIEPSLQSIGWPGGGAEEFLRQIRDQSGLLTGWDQEHYGFIHLNFQEYLAAREIRRLHIEGAQVLHELAVHHGESWWQEVALLTVAPEEPSLLEPYLREVVEQPTFSEEPALVDALLEDGGETPERPLVELVEREPGEDSGLWARQLLALRLLERTDSPSLKALRECLIQHPSNEIQRWLRSQAAAATRDLTVTENGGVELIRIPAGRFLMGSPGSEGGSFVWEGPQHEVTVSAFLIGRYPVTNEQYGSYLAVHPGTSEPDYWSDRQFNQAHQPVIGVSLDAARRFAEWVGGRLPTEAEWEYAARSGTTEPYLTGSTEKDLDRFAWYEENSGKKLHPVGEKEPNAWGLHDVLGNTWEWVEDDWHGSYSGAPADGSAWVEEPRHEFRVLRGGSFFNDSRYLRVACRYFYPPESRTHIRGFRVVCPLSAGQ